MGYSGAPSMNPPAARTGREGSIGVGRLRLFLGKKQVSTSSAGGVTRVDESRSRGIALVSKPDSSGNVQAKGFMKTSWTSREGASVASGESTLRGSQTKTEWFSSAGGSLDRPGANATWGTERSSHGQLVSKSFGVHQYNFKAGSVGMDTRYTKDLATGKTTNTTRVTRFHDGTNRVTTDHDKISSHDPRTHVSESAVHSYGSVEHFKPLPGTTTTERYNGVTGERTKSVTTGPTQPFKDLTKQRDQGIGE